MWPLALAVLTVAALSRGSLAAVTLPPGSLPQAAAALLGSWTCAGPIAGSASKELFTEAGRSVLRLENGVRTGAGAGGTVDETYAYDRATHTWTLSAPANRFFDRIHLTAGDARDGRWIFTGTQTTGNTVVPVRIAYAWLGAGTFRREHFERSAGVWRANGAFVCRRAGEPQLALVGSPFLIVERLFSGRVVEFQIVE